MITMVVSFTTERGNPNKTGFNLIYINLQYILWFPVVDCTLFLVTLKYSIQFNTNPLQTSKSKSKAKFGAKKKKKSSKKVRLTFSFGDPDPGLRCRPWQPIRACHYPAVSAIAAN